MKIKKLVPLLICIAVMIGIISISSVRKAGAPYNNKAEKSVSTPDETAEKSEEMRGVWISYYELSMENSEDKSENSFRNKFDKIAENCKGYGLNTLVVQVRPYGDALYKSDYYPWSHILTGEQGKNPEYDPLKIMCEITRKYNLKIHAWVNPYRVKLSKTPNKLAENNPYCENNNIGFETESGIFLDPSNEDAQTLITNGVAEIVKNYDVDGIQFDDYFYPEDVGGSDSESYENYTAKFGGDKSMNINNWRKANVNMLICRIYRAVHSAKKDVVFGISPQGNMENNEKLYADVKSWCACRGFVDYICPQLYFSLENPALTFEDALDSWSGLEFDGNVKMYVGLAGYKANTDEDGGTWKNSNRILADEYNILNKNNRVSGFMLYSYNSLLADEARGEVQNLKNELY